MTCRKRKKTRRRLSPPGPRVANGSLTAAEAKSVPGGDNLRGRVLSGNKPRAIVSVVRLEKCYCTSHTQVARTRLVVKSRRSGFLRKSGKGGTTVSTRNARSRS